MTETSRDLSGSRARSLAVLGGILMIIAGAYEVIQGIAALAHDKHLIVVPEYVFAFDISAWGWVHLVLGLALAAVGVCLLLAQPWARIAGMVLATVSAIESFFWLPYSPSWAALVIGMDVLVIFVLGAYVQMTRRI